MASVTCCTYHITLHFGVFAQNCRIRPAVSSLGLITVTRSSQAALNIFLKNYKRSKTQLHDLSSKLINEIMFHPFSELFTGCPSKHVSNISCQHSVTPFSLIQPLLICLTFSIKTALLLLWLKNSTHSAHKEQNIWTSLIFYAAPSVWNSLPHEIRHIQLTTAFETALKTHLFKSYLC